MADENDSWLKSTLGIDVSSILGGGSSAPAVATAAPPSAPLVTWGAPGTPPAGTPPAVPFGPPPPPTGTQPAPGTPSGPPLAAPPGAKPDEDHGPKTTVTVDGAKIESKPDHDPNKHKTTATHKVTLDFINKEHGKVFAHKEIFVQLGPDGKVSSVGVGIEPIALEIKKSLAKQGALAPLAVVCVFKLGAEAELQLKQDEKKTVLDHVGLAAQAAFAVGVTANSGTSQKKIQIEIKGSAGTAGFSVTVSLVISF